MPKLKTSRKHARVHAAVESNLLIFDVAGFVHDFTGNSKAERKSRKHARARAHAAVQSNLLRFDVADSVDYCLRNS